MPKSILGGLARLISNKAPVPFANRYSPGRSLLGGRSDATAQLHAMGQVGTLFSIVNRTSNAVAQVEWGLYRTAKSGKKEDRVAVTNHLALTIWNKPNDFFTRQLFIETSQQHVDLVGEGWWIVARDERARSIPLELWPVRPDRMTPIASPTDYLVGYVYTGPSGEQVPLQLDEVIQIRMPNPEDPYRGMGPVQTILTDLDSSRYSAEWNRNFFSNGAEPGGVVEIDKRLSDDEFDEMTERWREQHQGISNAHRVAILEQGAKWVPNAFTVRDMQFAELRNVSRDVIREAFGIPKFAVGDVDDVNRATADASSAWFSEHLTKPRLERIKGALNSIYLPLFGTSASGLEFDYDDPTPANSEAENAARDSKVNAAKTLIVDIGVVPKDAWAYLGLPEMEVEKPEPPPAPAPFGAGPPGVAPPALPAAPTDHWHIHTRSLLNADDPTADVDLAQVQADWEIALDRLLTQWRAVTEAQRQQIAEQVTAAVVANDPQALANLTADSTLGAALLAAAMAAMAASGAGSMVAEAAAQGVATAAGVADAAVLTATAATTAALLAAGMATAAGREALRHYSPAAEPAQVARAVDESLAGMSDAALRADLGGALTSAQNQGRIETLRLAPEGAIYASERNDRNTCKPCSEVDGRWLGNTSDLTAVDALYPAGQYIHCLGRQRCRGTVTGVWRPQQTRRGGV